MTSVFLFPRRSRSRVGVGVGIRRLTVGVRLTASRMTRSRPPTHRPHSSSKPHWRRLEGVGESESASVASRSQRRRRRRRRSESRRLCRRGENTRITHPATFFYFFFTTSPPLRCRRIAESNGRNPKSTMTPRCIPTRTPSPEHAQTGIEYSQRAESDTEIWRPRPLPRQV